MTMKKLAITLPQPKRPPGRPKQVLDHRKLDHIEPPVFASPEVAIESLLIFDARNLDSETRWELLRVIPEILRIQHAWRAEFMECGCISCHKKTPVYGAGGFCGRCFARIYQRMRLRYRKLMAGRDVTAELATFKEALTLRYSAAQRLLGRQRR
jgi:hypothetical protein